MSYYADAIGELTLSKKLTNSQAQDVQTILDFYSCDSIHGEEIVLSVPQNNYDEDEAQACLINLTNYLAAASISIINAHIEWHGEDGETWRFIVEDGKWVEQAGYFEWGESYPFD